MEQVICPHCGKEYKVTEKLRAASGKIATCKSCNKKFEIKVTPDSSKVDDVDSSVLEPMPSKSTELATKSRFDPAAKIEDQANATGHNIQILIAVILCLTGYGLIVGLPWLIVLTIKGNKLKGAWVGRCPKCSADILWHGPMGRQQTQGAFACPSCNCDIVFYSGKFVHKEPI